MTVTEGDRALLTKSFPTFDCDAHVTEDPAIWGYLSESERTFIKDWFWPHGPYIIVNGERVGNAQWGLGNGRISIAECAGPGVTKEILRELHRMEPTKELLEYANYRGAREATARIEDMDKQGIDQVVIVPVMLFNSFLWIKNVWAASLYCRAYNDWALDWCSADPRRLFPAGGLPVHSPELAATELSRIAGRGFRTAIVRPVDVNGRYPNQRHFDTLWRTFDETGLVVGMHSFTSSDFANAIDGSDHVWSVGRIVERALNPNQIGPPGSRSATLGFIHEAMAWLPSVLLSDFFVRFPGIKMAIMESNATWLPMLLESADKAAKLYKHRRWDKDNRLPSEKFFEHCFISFEGDEWPVAIQHEWFRDIAIWSSDLYHHDGADAWTALRTMRRARVPSETQQLMLGGNARRMYGIEPVQYVKTEEQQPVRPDWYPRKSAAQLDTQAQ